jgi:hypothetical protein
MPRRFLAALVLTLVSLAAILTVDQSHAADAAALATHRARLILSQAPTDARDVLATQKQFVSEKNRKDAAKIREVVVTGQIGGMPNVWPDTHPAFPWYPGQASFFLVDAKVAAQFAHHAKKHGGEECVFCRQLAANNVNAIAVVNLVDSEGKVLSIDLRKLVNLKENQNVTVRGKARLLAGSLLQIDADGIYVKSQKSIASAGGASTK